MRATGCIGLFDDEFADGRGGGDEESPGELLSMAKTGGGASSEFAGTSSLGGGASSPFDGASSSFDGGKNICQNEKSTQ